MGIEPGKRVSAKEAAEILGVPVHIISRLDVSGQWIKRYKLTRKTHVYDVQSLYAYLEAKLVTPLPALRLRADPNNIAAASRYVPEMPREKFSLREFLMEKPERNKK